MVVSSNHGTGYWMDIFTLICCKNWIVYLKKTENKRERGRGRHIVKKDWDLLIKQTL